MLPTTTIDAQRARLPILESDAVSALRNEARLGAQSRADFGKTVNQHSRHGAPPLAAKSRRRSRRSRAANRGKVAPKNGRDFEPRFWAQKRARFSARYINYYDAPKNGRDFEPRFWAQNRARFSARLCCDWRRDFAAIRGAPPRKCWRRSVLRFRAQLHAQALSLRIYSAPPELNY